MAILINGNGNPAIYAAQDADLIASLAGNTTGIAKVGNEFAYTAEDANTISVADGVIVTKEGRRIQLDAGENDTFKIPAGTAGVTNYYIIGYHLHENASGQQVADTFVQLMANATETIQEDTFRGGASDVYVSLYRVEQDGVNLGTITLLLPKLTNISQINSALTSTLLASNNNTVSYKMGNIIVLNLNGAQISNDSVCAEIMGRTPKTGAEAIMVDSVTKETVLVSISTNGKWYLADTTNFSALATATLYGQLVVNI